MRFSFDWTPGSFLAGMKSIDKPIATAATTAVKMAVKDAHARGQADILASGLGPRWAKSLKTRVYENDGINAAGIIYSGINFGVVFEKGATVKGKPTLWIPLQTTPKKLGRKPLTPKRVYEEIGHLFKIAIGGKEYLALRIAVSKRVGSGPLPLMSAAMLKNRARKPRKGQVTRLLPMFVAASSISIKKRLHIGEIAEAASDKLPEYFANAIKDE